MELNVEVVDRIVERLKTNGIFDEMRRDCLADIDTRPAFQNLKLRIENYVTSLLSAEVWTPTLNKNQLRSKVRMSVMQSGMLNTGVEYILHQVVDSKMYSEFLPKIVEFMQDNKDLVQIKKEEPEETIMDENIKEEEEQLPPQEEEEFNPGVVEDVENVEQPPDPKEEERSEEEGKEEIEKKEEEGNSPESSSPTAPAIPEGAANTLRNLLQTLMASNLQNLVAPEEEETSNVVAEEEKTGNSPSIDPAQIEAFTDDESDQTEPVNQTQPVNQSKDEVDETNVEIESYEPKTPSQVISPYSGDSRDSVHETIDNTEEEIEEVEEVEELQEVDSSQEIEEDQEEVQEDQEQEELQEEYEQEEEQEIIVEEQEEDIVQEEEVASPGEEGEQEQEEEEEEEKEEKVGKSKSHKSRSKREKKRKHKRRKRRHRSSSYESSSSGRRSSDSERSFSVSHKKHKKKKGKEKKKKKSRGRDSSDSKRPDSPTEFHRLSTSPHHSHRYSPQHQAMQFHEDRKDPVFPPSSSQFRPSYPGDHHEGIHPMEAAFHPRFSPPHYPNHRNSPPHFPPPRFGPQFNPSRPRMPPHFHMRGGSPHRYSPTFDYFHPRPGYDPQRSPPPNRRFSPPPRFMGHFPPGPMRPFSPEDHPRLRHMGPPNYHGTPPRPPNDLHHPMR
nr:biorientation of chromosomes in cell division protein 1-like 1 [Ciona intestinalis]|eukprot:XP_018671965.1 biorientation of chromosomes in cell division protein 1-like 1 [Ciona intestinalis]